jgi:hypothetical protein
LTLYKRARGGRVIRFVGVSRLTLTAQVRYWQDGVFLVISYHASFRKNISGWDGVSRLESWHRADAVVREGGRLSGIRAGSARNAEKNTHADLCLLPVAQPLAFASLARTRRGTGRVRRERDYRIPHTRVDELGHSPRIREDYASSFTQEVCKVGETMLPREIIWVRFAICP